MARLEDEWSERNLMLMRAAVWMKGVDEQWTDGATRSTA